MTATAPRIAADVLVLLAPVSGVVVPLEQVPDPAFAQRLAGDGASIDPLGDRVVAPCDGRVVQVHRAAHALTLEARGLEIVIHVGLDTVQLAGQGFRALVKPGTDVRAGDALLAFDADLVARRARSLLTQVVVTNMDRVAHMAARSGIVTAGRDVLLEVTLSGAADASADAGAARDAGPVVESPPIAVGAATGLHARPAAHLAAAARRFEAAVRLRKGERDANIRSVVSIMALEAAHGETVQLIARGPDASAAVAELGRMLASDLDAGDSSLSALGSRPSATESLEAASAAKHPEAPAESRGPRAESREPRAEGSLLKGVPASPGIAVGKVHRLRHEEIAIEERGADAAHERRALDTAIAAAHEQLESLRSRLATEADAGRAEIFAAHRQLLDDPELLDRAADEIQAGASAAWAWRAAYTAQAERLLALRDERLAARAADLRDAGRRVLHILAGHTAKPAEVPADSIVVAEDLAPSDAASLDRARVRGFCTTMGSATSHVAILARGLGIPAVAGIDPRVLDLAPGTLVLLDGDAGTLHPSPSEAETEVARRRQESDAERRRGELAAAAGPAVTRDGHRVEVAANLGDAEQARRVTDAGAEGVGLLRTEFLFMDRGAAPDEDEQARVYESIASALGPARLLVVRTLDVGGDKPLPYVPMPFEANPFLGERGVRLTLARPELFRAQVRAILRASPAGRVAIMFPMIATMAEWRAARELVERERAALGVGPVQVGIMVETPSAAVLADRFAREADFLSIGTNDLAQYTLAMDRTNPRLAPQADALHPAVLRLIERTVAGARAHGRWTGVCGALAGDPAAIPVLLGLGVDELSADVPLVPSVKARVRALSFAECQATAREALEADDAAQVREIVRGRHG
jgi:phosphoenolpyruvate-protein phosphotransferase